MNLEERARSWRRAWKAKPPEHAFNELAKTEPHPTLPYIGFEHVYILSPLGFALLYHPEGDDAVKTLLERGASPKEPTEKRIHRGQYNCHDAFQIACRYEIEKPFRLLLEYATPDTRTGLTPAYLSWVDAKHERTAACVCLGWLFTQMQRDDLIEPVVQRLAVIPLEDWTTQEAQPPVSKKIKLSSK